MNPKRHSTPEAGAYDYLRDGLANLRKAEQALTIIEHADPDPERALHLVAIRAAISQLVMFVPSVASVYSASVSHKTPPLDSIGK